MTIDLPPINLDEFETPKRRFSGHKNRAATIKDRELGAIVKRVSVFDSRNSASYTNGFTSVANGLGNTVTSTIQTATGALWIAQYEVSWFVDQFATSNEFPNGNFFNGSTAKQTAKNYDFIQFVSAAQSTNTKQIVKNRLVNNTGGAVNIGVIIKVRYIINSGGST